MRRLDLQLPTESPVETVDGLNRRPVTSRVRVLAERAGVGPASVVPRSSKAA